MDGVGPVRTSPHCQSGSGHGSVGGRCQGVGRYARGWPVKGRSQEPESHRLQLGVAALLGVPPVSPLTGILLESCWFLPLAASTPVPLRVPRHAHSGAMLNYIIVKSIVFPVGERS